MIINDTIIWINERDSHMIFINTLCQAQQGATSRPSTRHAKDLP
jgi:hypothetical protein